MAGKKKYTKSSIKAAIKGSMGIKLVVAQRLDCSRNTLDNYLNDFPDLKEMLVAERVPVIDEGERDQLVSLAEEKLVNDLNKGDQKAYMFVLETLGKSKGYTKRTELTGADGESLTISVETAAIIRRMGLDINDVAREFEEMIQAVAAAKVENPTP
jgi:hypothetical protein